MASRPKFWPRPRGFGLGLDSISLPDYIIRQEDRDLAEAKTLRPTASRPRPKFWPRGHFGPRGLNITGPFSVMLSPRRQSGLKTRILASASKLWPRPRGFGLGLDSISLPNYIIRLEDRDQAEAKTLRPTASRPRPRPKFWPRGQNFGLEDLTSLGHFQ